MDTKNNISLLTTSIQNFLRNDSQLHLPHGSTKEMQDLIEAVNALIHEHIQYKELCETEKSQKESAIAGIAHDLRVPLAAVMGCAAVLSSASSLPPEKQRHYLKALMDRSEEMKRLLDTLSETNHSTKPFLLHPTPTVLSEFIQNTLALWQSSLADQNIHISLDLDPTLTLSIDRLAFRRILSNLISNTAKYRTAPHSDVQISLQKENGHIVLTYGDDGSGLSSPAALSHLFDRGWRDPSRAGQISGTGLGLYIVSELIKAHGGTISAHIDHGLVFQMVLPQEVNDVKHTDC